jgi:hypothetical protein
VRLTLSTLPCPDRDARDVRARRREPDAKRKTRVNSGNAELRASTWPNRSSPSSDLPVCPRCDPPIDGSHEARHSDLNETRTHDSQATVGTNTKWKVYLQTRGHIAGVLDVVSGATATKSGKLHKQMSNDWLFSGTPPPRNSCSVKARERACHALGTPRKGHVPDCQFFTGIFAVPSILRSITAAPFPIHGAPPRI